MYPKVRLDSRESKKPPLNFLIKTLFFLLIFVSFFFVANSSVYAATYYVDATTGLDSDTGLTEDLAWQTLTKVNGFAFNPGDSILFKKGEIWREELTVPSSGSSGSPITFSVFGSGANPIFDGSDVAGAWTQYTTSSYETAFTGVVTGQWTDGLSRNYRNVIPSNTSAVDGTKIRITVQASSSGGGGTITEATIGPMTTGGVFDSAPTAITWDSGSASVTVAQGATKVSDEITFAFSKGQRYGIHIYTTDRDFVFDSTNGLGMYGMSNTSSSEATTLSPAGLTFNADLTGFVSLFEIYNTASVAGVWYQVTASDPIMVWDNNTALVQEDSVSDVVAINNTSYYTGGNIYIHTSDDSNPNSNGRGYDLSARTETFVDNGKNWLILEGVDHRKTAGDTSTIGGIKLTGSNNIVRNLSTYDHSRHGLCFYNGAQNNLVSNIEAYSSHTTSPICIYESLGLTTTNNTLDSSTIHNELATSGGSCISNHGGASGNTVSNSTIYGAGTGNWLVQIYAADSSLRITRNNIYGIARGGVYSWGDSSASQIDYNIINASQFDSTFSVDTAIRMHTSTNNKIYNNTIHGDNGNAAIYISNNSTGTVVKNNIVYGVDTYTFIDAGSITNTVFNNNLIYNLTGDFGTWNGSVYSSFALWKTGSSQDSSSLNTDPLFTNYGSADFTLNYLSPAINMGTNVSLTTDFLGNNIYGTPDIGAYEYQPPYTTGTDEIDISGNVRVYTDGKFRNTQTTSGTTADLSITPVGGFGSGDYSEWMNITINTWDSTKNWSESSTSIGSASTIHTVGDLLANTGYTVDLDGNPLTTAASNSSGQIIFTYSGGYSSHTFNVHKTPDPAGPPVCSDTVPGSAPWLYDAISESKDSIRVYFTDAQDPVDKYVLEYGTEPGVYQFSSVNIGGKGTKTYLVEWLSPDKTYYFRVRGGNGCATGPWSNEISAKTKSLTPWITEEKEETEKLEPGEKEEISKPTKPEEIPVIEAPGKMVTFLKNTSVGVGNFIRNVFRYTKETVASGYKILAQGIKKPKEFMGKYGEWISYSVISFKEIVLDKEPTKISNVKVEKLTPTSAVIFWKTNHLSDSKVNWGETLDYGKTVQADEKVHEHRIEITGLEPESKYFYEVMSQNKNYVYDANHEFTTPKE